MSGTAESSMQPLIVAGIRSCVGHTPVRESPEIVPGRYTVAASPRARAASTSCSATHLVAA